MAANAVSQFVGAPFISEEWLLKCIMLSTQDALLWIVDVVELLLLVRRALSVPERICQIASWWDVDAHGSLHPRR